MLTDVRVYAPLSSSVYAKGCASIHASVNAHTCHSMPACVYASKHARMPTSSTPATAGARGAYTYPWPCIAAATTTTTAATGGHEGICSYELQCLLHYLPHPPPQAVHDCCTLGPVSQHTGAPTLQAGVQEGHAGRKISRSLWRSW